MLHHTAQPNCPNCEEKLKQCDPRLVSWFHFVIQAFPDAHISWGYRGEKDQDEAVASGKSKDIWPSSPHNHRLGAVPSSLALDLFQLLPDGSAQFNHAWYQSIYLKFIFGKTEMAWGGVFQHLKDYDHYYLRTV